MRDLFSYNSDIRKNAYLNWRTDHNDQIGNLCVLGDDFATGAEQLMNSILENNSDKKADALIMPIMYCIDQYIELTTKAVIWLVEDLLGEARSKITTHDIAQLKQTMVSRIRKKETKTAGLEKALQPVTDYIDALYAKIKTTDDKGRPVINIDFARYPFSVDGESHFYISDPENVVVDIEKLAEWFQQIRDSLDDLYYMYSDEWENRVNP